MATLDEKAPGIEHQDDLYNVDTAVHIAHETTVEKVSPWTWPMFRLYLVLAVAYLCGCVLHCTECPWYVYRIG